MSNTPRKYSDQEVAEILERATEGDPARTLPQAEDTTLMEGTTLAELKSIGAEVGIEPSRIEGAARSLVRAPEAKANLFLGAPTAVDHEVRVPGAILSEDTPEVIAIIRRITGTLGEVSDLKGTVEWRTTGEMGTRWVTVSSKDGETVVRASARMGRGAAMSLIPTVAAAAVSFVPVLNAPSADGNMLALILIPLVLALYLTTRSLWSRHVDKEDRRLQQIVDELSRLAEVPESGSTD